MRCVKKELAEDFRTSSENITTCLVIAGIKDINGKETAGAILNLDGTLEEFVDLILDTTFNSFISLDDPEAIPQQKEQALKTLKILSTLTISFKKGMLAYMEETLSKNTYSSEIKKEFDDLAVRFIDSLNDRNGK